MGIRNVSDVLWELRSQAEILDYVRVHGYVSNGISSMAPHSSRYAELRAALFIWMDTGELPKYILD